MQQAKRYLILISFSFLVFACSTGEQSDSLRVLFIGNSYSYFNSTPELVKALFQEKYPDRKIETRLVSQGGMTLQMHWQGEEALAAIRSQQWDYVVLQEQSKLGMGVMIDRDIYFGNTDLFFEYARKFDTEIKKSGAETVFFMTWSIKSRPEEQEILTYAYSKIAQELDAKLVPVGLAWATIRTDNQFDLYAPDGSHPSPWGSYLVATTMFATLSEETPIGLSGSLSGKKLSRSGQPSSETTTLVTITNEDARKIQEASWSHVEALQSEGDYPEVKRPQPTYVLPEVVQQEPLTMDDITGRWYGTTAYGFNYLGLVLDANEVDGKLDVDMVFYSPDQQDRMTVLSDTVENNLLILNVYDSLRTLSSRVSLAFTEDQKLTGLIESFGNIALYRHLTLSKEKVQQGLDLVAYDELWQVFQSSIDEQGYVQAAVNHYANYSELIGETYQPEERYLNAQGYNFLRDGRVNDALDQFALANYLYPESVNTYDSYAEALVIAGDKEKALAVYTEGYELAKKTGDENLAYIEANLNKLKEGEPVEQELQAPPPPPPTR